jgi:hypothetical protein
MAASTVPACKQAILDLLKARPALNEVAITWGAPTETEDLAEEMVFFDDPVVRRPNWGPLGAGNIDEEYVLTLKVRNHFPDDDQAAAETRAWELVYEIEQSLRGQRPGGLLKPIDFDEQEYRTNPLSDGWFGEISIPLVCTARI